MVTTCRAAGRQQTPGAYSFSPLELGSGSVLRSLRPKAVYGFMVCSLLSVSSTEAVAAVWHPSSAAHSQFDVT